MNNSNIWALVPFKGAPGGKSRLAEHLAFDERRDLALAMLRDVLNSLCYAPELTGVLLSSRAQEAKALLDYPKIRLYEDQAENLADAVTEASEYLRNELSAESVFIVPGDVPLIKIEDISCALRGHCDVTLLPDEHDVGTNGVISTPPNNFKYVFDGKSFEPHRQAAIREGYQPRIVRLMTFAHDIDTVSDLKKVRTEAPNSCTSKFLASSQILERISNAA